MLMTVNNHISIIPFQQVFCYNQGIIPTKKAQERTILIGSIVFDTTIRGGLTMAKTMEVPEQCPMDVGLNILSGKWTLRILWHLSKGPVRFNELQRLLGTITTKTLSQQLRQLEEQQMILRTVYPETPPKVEYSLTEVGKTIQPILKELCEWGTNYQKAISSIS